MPIAEQRALFIQRQSKNFTCRRSIPNIGLGLLFGHRRYSDTVSGERTHYRDNSMPLLSFWDSNPEATDKLSIQQIVGTAGDGKLRDNSQCSEELREYFRQVSSGKLAEYIDHCLSESFADSGLVLQDLVNELGRRLDFEVTNGAYQGKKGAIGNDGLWQAPEGGSIVVEVKTTDAYRISLDTVAEYRRRLHESDLVGGASSILLVVGRKDTGELEAQVRGSRHAWDVRLISMDALISLVRLKENSEEKETAMKIRSVLIPMEYTRLDALVDVMFTTAKDVETAGETEPSPEQDTETTPESKGTWEFTDSQLLQQKREAIVSALAEKLETKFIRKSRALFWDAPHQIRVCCSISKRYTKQGAYPYWYAYHPQWDEFLAEGSKGLFVMGCMDLDYAFAIPRSVMAENVEFLNTTTKQNPEVTYWHIHLIEPTQGHFALLLPKKPGHLALDEYVIALG